MAIHLRFSLRPQLSHLLIIMKEISYIFFISVWFLGMAMAAGWWKLLAIIFPPYSLYLVAERVVATLGAISV